MKVMKHQHAIVKLPKYKIMNVMIIKMMTIMNLMTIWSIPMIITGMAATM